MTNAARCLATAANYARLADRAAAAEARHAFRRLERVFLDMAPLADSYDRRRDEPSKQRIFELTDKIGELRREFARREPVIRQAGRLALASAQMSRAFVKETDEVPDLPDRPISPHPNLVTERGLRQIEAAVARHEAALGEASAAVDAEGVSAAQRELRYWTQRRATAEVQPPPADCDIVRFGCVVTVERDDPTSKRPRRQAFRIVGEDEADPKGGSISYASPLARALMGKSVGDVAQAGQGEAEIVAIG